MSLSPVDSFGLCTSGKVHHPSLPRDSTSWRVTPVPEEVPLLLACLGSSVGALHIQGVVHVSAFSPDTRLYVPLLILVVHQPVLEYRVASAHDVVEEHTSPDDELHCISMLVHGHQENLKTVG